MPFITDRDMLYDAYQDVEIIVHSYLHEYQFMSVSANHVSRNVAIIGPEGANATEICERERILRENGRCVSSVSQVKVSAHILLG